MSNTNKYLIVGLAGGLGNQLFQYAAARSLSERIKCKIYFDVSWYIEKEDRVFLLNKFLIKHDIIPKPFYERHFSLFLNRAIRRFSPYNYGLSVFREKKYSFNEEFNTIKKPVYLEGYWQSQKYFMNIRNILLNELILQDPLPLKCKNIFERISNSNSVCVHVRRGDYVRNLEASKLHAICNLDYYTQAMVYASQKIENPKFFIFSDDLEWVKRSFAFDYEMYFVDINTTLEPHLDLQLMSACKNFIIANSTLSWWAAWIAIYEKKIVIAPDNWFLTEERDLNDLLPVEWKKI